MADGTISRVSRPQGVEDHRFRFRSRETFGGIQASTLSAILGQLDRGRVERWVDLCSWAITTDPDVLSYYESRIERVVQADWVIAPPKRYRDDPSAKLQAEIVNDLVERIPRFEETLKLLLDAIATGFSAAEIIWDADRVRKLYYPREVVWRHSRRFRFGPDWDHGLHRDLRVYDLGQRQGHDTYGDVLEPKKWITHFHVTKADYPSHFGIMRAVIWWWMFRRWNMKGRINVVERFGQPTVVIYVDKNTPDAIRNEMREAMEQASYDSNVIVTEEGNKVEHVSSSGGGQDIHRNLDQDLLRSIERAFLGSSDATAPGSSGDRAAVEGRLGALADPRMVTDGSRLSETLRNTLFSYIIHWNLFRLGIREHEIIAPVMRLKTADDEVDADAGDRQEEIQDESAAAQQDQGVEVEQKPVAASRSPLSLVLSGKYG